MSTSRRIGALAGPLVGRVGVPGDKSISHRAVLLSAMAEGVSQVSGILDSQDVRSSIAAARQLGARVDLGVRPDGSLAGVIEGWGSRGPIRPSGPVDCGNSGTTVRLLMGVLAPWDVEVRLTGDDSLRRRPMRRITEPLVRMGARFELEGGDRLPVVERGRRPLRAIRYESPVASAQLKTAVLLAGLGAEGKTVLVEPAPSRNHTELMLPEYGADVESGDRFAEVAGPCILHAARVAVPGDPSSAAFPVCAALLKPGSSVVVENVSLSPARVGFLRVLQAMGADISVRPGQGAGREPVGDIAVRYTPGLYACEVPAREIASLIDEIPVLALVAATARGTTVFREAGELRVKESDRADAIVEGLALIGVRARMDGDDLFVEGVPGLTAPAGLTIDSRKDHRLAMTWALAAMCLGGAIDIPDFDCVSVSYPTFLETFERLQA